MNLAEALRREGLTVNEVDGWQRRCRPGAFAPIGAVFHHTAGTKSLGIIIHGRPDLPGPLAHLHLEKSGAVNLIAAGRCNHAGRGSGEVLDRIGRGLPPRGDAGKLGLVDNTDGNALLWGIEVENLGDGRDPFPQEQLDAIARIGAALCRYSKFPPHACVHHREWTRRKIDMTWRGPLRDIIAARIITTPGEAIVAAKYDPPVKVEPIVDDMACPTGGAWTLAESGAVNAWAGAPYLGGANGKPYFAGRKAARLELADGKYRIVASSGERYGPDF